MNFDELLGEYKANPRRESAALLLSDPALLKYCVIFKQVPVRRFEDYPLEATWGALWDCVHVDIETIALLANDVLVEARNSVERIKALRLVFPDGTAQELVNKVILKGIKDALS